MPNTKGGKNYKKGKRGPKVQSNHKTPLAENENHRYAQVDGKMGGVQLRVICSDNITRRAIIPGSFRRKVWMNVGDIVLVELSQINKSKDECYVLYKYEYSEAQDLKAQGLFSFDVKDTSEADVQFGDNVNDIENKDDIYDKVDELLSSEEDNEDDKGAKDKKQDKNQKTEKQKKKEKQKQQAQTKTIDRSKKKLKGEDDAAPDE
jgi:translation initiation factor 1A